MSFSINLDFFLDKISDNINKNLMIEHHNLIKKHIESLNQLIIIKKELLILYQNYNNNIPDDNQININNNYFDIMRYIHDLEESIKKLDQDADNQKHFFKKNIFKLSNF
jgi:hypothetical protein